MGRRHVRALSGVRLRSVSGVLAAVLRPEEGAARRLLGDAVAADPRHVAELLHAASAQHLRRLPNGRAWQCELSPVPRGETSGEMTLMAPRTLYIHDDLSERLRARGEGSPAWRLGQTLLAALRRDAGRIVVLTVAEQLDALIARGAHTPFPHTIGIGRAGAGVAARIHARTGWFPSIHRVDVWREEDGAGGYVLTGPAPLAAQLGPSVAASPIAVVDDTIFSGLTMRT